MVQQLDSNTIPEQRTLDIAKDQHAIIDRLEKIIESLKLELSRTKNDVRLLKEQVKIKSQNYY